MHLSIRKIGPRLQHNIANLGSIADVGNRLSALNRREYAQQAELRGVGALPELDHPHPLNAIQRHDHPIS